MYFGSGNKNQNCVKKNTVPVFKTPSWLYPTCGLVKERNKSKITYPTLIDIHSAEIFIEFSSEVCFDLDHQISKN